MPHIIDHPSRSEFSGTFVSDDDLPRVSFCIPTFNDEQTISSCLQSISKQEYPDIEIILVDGYSDDNTVAIAESFADEIHYDDGNLGSARQTSIDHATGEIIGLFDADIILPHNEWLYNAVSFFNYSDKVSTVWPQNVAPPDGTLLTDLYFNHWNLIIEDRIENERGLYGGGNSLFRRECLEAIGAIDTSLHWGEDFDWSRKLKDRGYQVVYLRDPVYHDTMRSLGTFFQKQFLGAEAFTDSGFGLMGLTMRDILREQFLLGTVGMVKGVMLNRDASWLLYPPYIASRSLAYAATYLKQGVANG